MAQRFLEQRGRTADERGGRVRRRVPAGATLAVIVAAALGVACSGSSSGGNGPGGGGGGGGGASSCNRDGCNLITASDVATALGQDIGACTDQTSPADGMGMNLGWAYNDHFGPGPSFLFTLTCFPTTLQPGFAQSVAQALTTSPMPVNGIGTDASFGAASFDSGPPAYILVVVAKSNQALTLTFWPGGSNADPLTVLKALASDFVSRA